MKFLFVLGFFTLFLIGGLFPVSYSFGQTQTTSDFTVAIQTGLQALAANPTAQIQQQQIQSQDYKSSWDEFGISALIDGTMPPAEVNKKITQDIVQSVQTAQNYDQQEADYLQTTQTTPEQIQTIEESTGSDVPPGKFVDPNPSLDANPDISASPVDNSTEETSTAEANNSAQGATISTPETNASTTEINTSTSEMSTSSETQIFDAILQGEMAAPVSSGTDATPPPAEPVPPSAEPAPTEPTPTP